MACNVLRVSDEALCCCRGAYTLLAAEY